MDVTALVTAALTRASITRPWLDACCAAVLLRLSPVLVFHGLQDQLLNSNVLNGNWQWIEADYTQVTVPAAGHFVHRDAADLVTSTLRAWLLDRP